MRLKKHLRYSAEAEWDHKTGGTAQMDDFMLDFDTPMEHGGKSSAPCPDQLFMTSLAGCVINTFNYYREMFAIKTRGLKVNVSSDIELKSKGYMITGINIAIQVWCCKESLEHNQKCAERARDFCHLTKSIESSIPIKTTINLHLE
jgi:uncharacterized OsmC-like protein